MHENKDPAPRAFGDRAGGRLCADEACADTAFAGLTQPNDDPVPWPWHRLDEALAAVIDRLRIVARPP
jgi:hypothetical protein